MPRVTPITTKDQVAPEHRPVFDAVAEGRGSVRGPFSIMMYSRRCVSGCSTPATSCASSRR